MSPSDLVVHICLTGFDSTVRHVHPPAIDDVFGLIEASGGAARRSDLRRVFGWRAVAAGERAGRLVPEGVAVLTVGPTADLCSRFRRAEVATGMPLIAALHTAAALHGFGVIDDATVHATTANGWSKPGPPGVVIHQAVPRAAAVVVDGVLATAPADTAVDVACAVDDLSVLAVLDAALRAGVSILELENAAAAARGRRGVRKVRDWLPYADWRADSPMESRSRARVLTAGLPAPDLQVPVLTAAGRYRYLDLGWIHYRLGIDYDGEQFHALDSLAGDRRRHNELTEAGWTMLYPTSRDVFLDHASLIRTVVGALRTAGFCGPIGRKPDPDTVPRPAGCAAEYLALSRRRWSGIDSTR